MKSPLGNYKQKVMGVMVCCVVSTEWFDLYGVIAEAKDMIFHVFGTTHYREGPIYRLRTKFPTSFVATPDKN